MCLKFEVFGDLTVTECLKNILRNSIFKYILLKKSNSNFTKYLVKKVNNRLLRLKKTTGMRFTKLYYHTLCVGKFEVKN